MSDNQAMVVTNDLLSKLGRMWLVGEDSQQV